MRLAEKIEAYGELRRSTEATEWIAFSHRKDGWIQSAERFYDEASELNKQSEGLLAEIKEEVAQLEARVAELENGSTDTTEAEGEFKAHQELKANYPWVTGVE